MRRIPTLFERDFDNRGQITEKCAEGTEWVQDGEEVATRKYDGTSCMVRGGKLYRRAEVKAGRTPPPGFELVHRDEQTGKTVGWVEVGWGSEDKWHRSAIPGGNPEHVEQSVLLRHDDAQVLDDAPRTYQGLRDDLAGKDIEGIVWHHPGGRMAKIKLRDFGLVPTSV